MIRNAIQNVIQNVFEINDLTAVECRFVLEGKAYEVARFQILFGQPSDHKGQPQHETKGGQFSFAIRQAADDILFDWAKRANKLKTGRIEFHVELQGTLLRIDFIDAACISLVSKINAFSGMETMLIVTASKVVMDGVTHDNRWKL